MSYLYRVLHDSPMAVWPLDAISAGKFLDSSGYGKDATVVGSPITARPLVAKGIAAQRIVDTGFTLPISNIMIAGSHMNKFSLEAWVKLDSLAGTFNLFKRDSSGIFINGDTVTATVQMSSAISIVYSGLKLGRTYQIVMAYDTQGVYLYINGVLVGTQWVQAADLTASFADTTTTLTVSSSSSAVAVVDSLAIYNYPLKFDDVFAHYTLATSFPDVVSISSINNSTIFSFCDDNATVRDQILAYNADSWAKGLNSGFVYVVDDHIENTVDGSTGNFGAGTWKQILSFEPEATTLQGSRITWDANDDTSNLVVSVSTDGTTFTPVTNGSQPFSTLNLTNGVDITVLVSISATTTKVEADRLNLVLYTSKSITSDNTDIVATITGQSGVTLSEFNWNPAQFVGDSGALITGSTSGYTIPPDTVFGGYTAVEMTVKFSSSTANATIMSGNAASNQPTITTNGSGQWVTTNLTALYVDGAAVTSPATIAPNVWHHVIAVFPTTSASFYIGNAAAFNVGFPTRIGHLAMYYKTLTATMVSAIYAAWVGASFTRLVDGGIATVAESIYADSSAAFHGYTYTWSISGADV